MEHPFHAELMQLLEFMGCPSWQPETRKSARSTLRTFYRWAHGMGYISDDPSLQLPAVRVPPPVARPTPEHLVAQIVRRDDRIGFMAQLAAYGGLRVAEIAQVHQRDLVGDVLVVTGKGRKVREVPVVHRQLLRRLEAVEGWAFPNGYGTHLSPGHVCKLLSQELPEHWTAHTLRHRMASVGYAATRDLLAVGKVLGHSRPETTQRYVKLPDDAVRSVMAAASA